MFRALLLTAVFCFSSLISLHAAVGWQSPDAAPDWFLQWQQSERAVDGNRRSKARAVLQPFGIPSVLPLQFDGQVLETLRLRVDWQGPGSVPVMVTLFDEQYMPSFITTEVRRTRNGRSTLAVDLNGAAPVLMLLSFFHPPESVRGVQIREAEVFSMPASAVAGSDSGPLPVSDAPTGARMIRLAVRDEHVTETLHDVPVAVLLNEARAPGFGQLAAAGVQFYLPDGTVLASECEHFNAHGESLFWVKLPVLQPGIPVQFAALYGSGDASFANSAAVWSNGYDAVLHLSHDLSDSLGAVTTSGEQLVRAAGRLGDARYFDGSDAVLESNLSTSPDAFAYSAWLFREAPTNSFPRLFECRQPDGAAEQLLFINHKRTSGPLALRLQADFGQDGSYRGINAWSDWKQQIFPESAWVHVHVQHDRRDGANPVRYFFNGVESGLDSSRSRLASGPLRRQPGARYLIGNNEARSRGFHGRMDEIRFAHVLRSPAWVTAQYLAQTDQLLDYRPCGLNVDVPTDSVTSPVSIRGETAAPALLTMRGSGQVSALGKQAFHLDVPLHLDRARRVRLYSPAAHEHVDAQIVWQATAIDSNADEQVIRAGDALLFEAPVGTATVTVDRYLSSAVEAVESLSLDANAQCVHRFEQPGYYTVTARDLDQQELGRLDVTAIVVQFPESVAVHRYQSRKAHVRVYPPGARDHVTITSADRSQLEVTAQHAHEDDERLLAYDFFAAGDAGVLIASIGSDGPMLASRVVDVFVVETRSLYNVVVDQGAERGSTAIVMKPLVPSLDLHLDMFGGSCTFAGGERDLYPSGSDFTPVIDEATGRSDGRLLVDIDFPLADSSYCYRINYAQATLWPAEPSVYTEDAPAQVFVLAGGDVGVNSDNDGPGGDPDGAVDEPGPVPVGVSGNINGNEIRLSVNQVVVCNDDESATMNVVLEEASDEADGRWPAKILANPSHPDGGSPVFETPSLGGQYVSEGAVVSTKGAGGDSGFSEDVSANGAAADFYDIQIDETTFEDRIVVVDLVRIEYKESQTVGAWQELGKDSSASIGAVDYSYSFRVVCEPAGFYSTAGITWTGVNGSGRNAYKTWSECSEDTSDANEITVSCGNQTLTGHMLIDCLELEVTWDDSFAGRSEDSCGIREPATVYARRKLGNVVFDVDWDIDTDNASTLTANHAGSGSADFVAGYRSGSATITATVYDEPFNYQELDVALTIVEPSSGYLEIAPGTPTLHITNTASVGLIGEHFIVPTEVSFFKLFAKEGGGTPTTSTGLFAGIGNHPPSASWFSIGTGHITNGCKWNANDCSFFLRNAPYQVSELTWPIDILYKFDSSGTGTTGGIKYGVLTSFNHIDAAGKAQKRKNMAGPVSAEAADPTVRHGNCPRAAAPPPPAAPGP